MKIYTKTGDNGETGIIGGLRVSKGHDVVKACGDIDETNSLIGLAISHGVSDSINELLGDIQQVLFVIGCEVASSMSNTDRTAKIKIDQTHIEKLERAIDRFNDGLPVMDAFILPGGNLAAAQLHVARCVCRRAERSVVELANAEELKSDLADLRQVVVYLNRLSDLLFVAARRINFENEIPESKWQP